MSKIEITPRRWYQRPKVLTSLVIIPAFFFMLKGCEFKSVQSYAEDYLPESRDWKLLNARQAWYGLGRPPPGGTCALFKVDAATLAKVVRESQITPPATEETCWSQVGGLPDDYVCGPIVRGRWGDNQSRLVASSCWSFDAHGTYVNEARNEIVFQRMSWGD